MSGRAWAAIVVVIAAGCGDSSGSEAHSPCAVPAAMRPAACGQSCTETTPCAVGYYCGSDGRCTADCERVAGTPYTCARGFACTADGHCEHTDAGTAPAFDAGDPNICAGRSVGAQRVTPNVILIVDQSGSMTERFGRSNRWDALRNALLAQPDGFVFALQDQVKFGLALFSARTADDESTIVGMCPLITWQDPALHNYEALSGIYRPAMPIDETPTGDSIDAVLARTLTAPDRGTDPTVFILATDGEPDSCEQPNPQNGQAESLAATRRAFAAGVRTYIVSVGSEVSARHLQDVANAGVGNTEGAPNAPYWTAGDDAGLREALQAIIGGELSCTVRLEGRIQRLADACSGTVRLNGAPLTCNDPNGWRVVDDTHIELVGNACRTLQTSSGAHVDASFPCDVVVF